MDLLWQLSSNGIKLQSDFVVATFLSGDSDKLAIVFDSHLVVLSLGKIVFDEIILDSFVDFDSFLAQVSPEALGKGKEPFARVGAGLAEWPLIAELLVVNEAHACFAQINAGMKLQQMRNGPLLASINRTLEHLQSKRHILGNESLHALFSNSASKTLVRHCEVLEDS